MVLRMSPKTFNSSLLAALLTSIKSLELGGRGRNAASNSKLLGCTTTKGYRGLVGTDSLKASEGSVWEDQMAEAIGVMSGIPRGRFGRVEKEQMPLLAG